MLDLLQHCALLRQHVAAERVFFGINHEMRDFQQNRKKDLDLVLCTGADIPNARAKTFTDMGGHYGIDLTAQEKNLLDGLPILRRAPVGAVLVALEAKACMTEHGKARPRLYDELNSSHLTIHGNTDGAIAAGLVVVNHAVRFISPNKNATGSPWSWNNHIQPNDTARIIEKISELPRRAAVGREGFDALAVLTLDCANDGSPVRLITAAPAAQPGDALHYDTMIHRMAQAYATRFAQI